MNTAVDNRFISSKALAKFSIFLVVTSMLLGSLLSVPLINSEAETPTGKITIGNTVPTAPSVFGVQDTSSATLMDTAIPDTHMIGTDLFNMSWTPSTDANGDAIYYYLCIASSAVNRDANNCDIKYSANQTKAWNKTDASDTVLTYGGASKTFYVRINATDEIGWSTNYDTDFAILNSAPTCAPVAGLIFGTDGTGQTHQTTVAGISNTKVDWADCTDADTAGTADHYPADSLVYNISIGDATSGDTERTADISLPASEKSDAYDVALIFGTSITGTTWVNESYYYRITADDQQATSNSVSANADGGFTLFNQVPSVASAWDTSETHDPTPSVSYTGGTDPDTDSVTCHITAGNAGDYEAIISEADAKTGVSSATFWDKTIPWNTTEMNDGGWANYTVDLRIWCVDDKTPTLWYDSNQNYSANMILYDNLPDITTLEITDAGGLADYADCSSSCAINPVEGTNATVAVRVTFTDTDSDCTSGHNVYAHFCYNTTTGQACSEAEGENNATYKVDSVTGASTCVAVFSVNKTASDGTPQFWMDDATYKIHLNATSQSGVERATDTQKEGTWLYNKLRAINYPSTLLIGDATIEFYTWNTNTTAHTGINNGNHPLKMNWNITNPTCSPESSSTCGNDVWTLNGTDFRLDDDNDPTVDTGNQVYVDLTFYPAGVGAPQFDHTTSGLLNCNIYSCASPTNATLGTYFHIAPPSLRAGTYNSTFTITLADFA